MFHMLTCFNLKPEFVIDDFRKSVTIFIKHMQDIDLVQTAGPIGRRHRDTIMDTDNERNHEFFFTMSFRDREQCDKAVTYLLPHQEPGESVHKEVYTKVKDQIFTCWEDI